MRKREIDRKRENKEREIGKEREKERNRKKERDENIDEIIFFKIRLSQRLWFYRQ